MDQAQHTEQHAFWQQLLIFIRTRKLSARIIYDEESVVNTKICFTVATRRHCVEILWASQW